MQRQLRLGVEAERLWDGAASPQRVMRLIKPALRHIEATVGEGASLGAAVGGKDTLLAVCDLAQVAAVLACDAYGEVALLGEAAAVDDEHALGGGPASGPPAADGGVVPCASPKKVCMARTAAGSTPRRAWTMGSTVLRSRSESWPRRYSRLQ